MTRVILILTALALSAGSAQATFLKFDGTKTNGAIASDWGSNSAAAATGISVDNGATPNVALSWSASRGGTWEFYNDKEWTAAQMDGFDTGVQFDLVFTPDAGYAVQVTSFVFDNYVGYAGGSTFIWQLFEDGEGGALINGGIQRVADGADQEIATDMASAYSGAVLLRLTALLGDGKDAALDSISFTQTASVPEPGTLALLSAVLLGLWAYGRRTA